MTCNCIEKVVAALEAEAQRWFATGDANNANLLNYLSARLTPPPATDWREKCKVVDRVGLPRGWNVYLETTTDKCHYLTTDGVWTETWNMPAEQYCFPTESAARAALAAATEPRVQPARGPCTCNRNHVDDDEHAPDCGKPAPAVAFDAEKWAEKMVRPIIAGGLAGLHELDGSGGYCAFYQDEASNQARINHARQIIVAALRAAESAGYARAKAEQTKPAAPAAAKEGP